MERIEHKTDYEIYKIIEIGWKKLVWAKGRLLKCEICHADEVMICSRRCCINEGNLCLREYFPDYGYPCDKVMSLFSFLEFEYEVYFRYYEVKSLIESRYILKRIK